MEDRGLATGQREGKRQDAEDWGVTRTDDGIVVMEARKASLFVAVGAIRTRGGVEQPWDGVAPRKVQSGVVIFRNEGDDAAGDDRVRDGDRHSLDHAVTEAGEDDAIASGIRGDHWAGEDHHLGPTNNQPLVSSGGVHEEGEPHRQGGRRGQDGAGLGNTVRCEGVGARESGKVASGLDGHIMDSRGGSSSHGEQER